MITSWKYLDFFSPGSERSIICYKLICSYTKINPVIFLRRKRLNFFCYITITRSKNSSFRPLLFYRSVYISLAPLYNLNTSRDLWKRLSETIVLQRHFPLYDASAVYPNLHRCTVLDCYYDCYDSWRKSLFLFCNCNVNISFLFMFR